MRKRILVHAITLCAIALFAALGAGTSSSNDSSSSRPSSSSTDNSAHAALSELESHMSTAPYGEGPGAAEVARIVHESTQGDRVAVKVIESTRRRIVVLVRLDDLRDLDDSERRDELDAILMDLDEAELTRGADVGIGIRGTIFYGAVALRPLGERVHYDTSPVASTDALAELLLPVAGQVGAPPAAAAPAATGPNAQALAALNELCGDIWCEGEHEYTFTSLECQGTTCQLGVDVRDFVEALDDLGPPTHHVLTLQNVTSVTDEGTASESLSDAVSAAIGRFEHGQR